MKIEINRRYFLRGLGAGIALPTFETFLPGRSLSAEEAARAAGGKAVTAGGMPLRMAFLYKPNGVNVQKWEPKGTGSNYQLNETQRPFARFKKDIHLIGKLEHKNGMAGKDGGGDHARANASFLTGARPYKTAGADIHLGISVDQVVAHEIRDLTRFASLELACDGTRKSGVCDSGYSCAYQFNLSWRSPTTPMTAEVNPRLVFERLFGAGDKGERTRSLEMRTKQQRSLLDFVLEDAREMNGQLGRNDQQKLDEYLTGVREIERRIEAAERFGPPEDPGLNTPKGIPSGFQEHIRLMMDMMLAAFETDSTRVASFLLAYDGSNRNFSEIGVPDGHHAVSHHKDKPELLAKLAKIDLFYSRQFAYFLEQAAKKKDADGSSLLHNSMIIWGGGLADPNRHRHSNLPIVLAGHGGGSIKQGRHTVLGQDTPMSNLYLSMMDRMGVKKERFGDSTGRLTAV